MSRASITPTSILEAAIAELRKPGAGAFQIAEALFRLELLQRDLALLEAAAGDVPDGLKVSVEEGWLCVRTETGALLKSWKPAEAWSGVPVGAVVLGAIGRP